MAVPGTADCIRCPAVRLSAHIDEHIAVRNLPDIFCVRLIVMQINSIFQQIGHTNMVCIVRKDLLYPVICSIAVCHDINGSFVIHSVFSWLCSTGC